MSMLSSLIDELDKSADEWNSSNMFELARMCREAADTIWQLRDDLQRANVENAKLREQSERLFDRTLELGTENAKLRELMALWSVINKHMSRCATIDCGQCPVREECGESVYLEGLLGIDSKELSWRVQERVTDADDVQTENAKLRELCKAWHKFAYELFDDFIGEPEMSDDFMELDGRMRELVVEV